MVLFFSHFCSEVSVIIFHEVKKIGINEAEGLASSFNILFFCWQFLTVDLAFDKHVFSDR